MHTFFSQNPQMARRTVGLQFGSMNYDDEFKEFCKILFSYQYVKKIVFWNGCLNIVGLFLLESWH